MSLSQCLLVFAWGIAVVGCRSQPLPTLIAIAIMVASGLFLLGYWFRPETIPSYSGILNTESELLFSADGKGSIPKIQIGQSSAFITSNDPTKLLLPALKESQFMVEKINGKIKISTKITGQNGDLIAEIIRNEWKVGPIAWDYNYSDNSFEVKDARGLVVLQVRVLSDCIQIQGAWWVDMGPQNGMVHMYVMQGPVHGPPEEAAKFVFVPKNYPESSPSITAIFEYPSNLHFGEIRKQ